MNRLGFAARAAVLALLVLATVVAPAAAATVEGNLVNVDKHGVILDGYDPVAFFTDGKPVLGSAAFSSRHEGAVYRFASAEHKRLFDENPAKYAPQFGGYCALAVSLGRTAPISIDTWSILDGRLVLQHNARAVRLWNTDPAGNLKFADQYWPEVVANGGKQIDVPQRY